MITKNLIIILLLFFISNIHPNDMKLKERAKNGDVLAMIAIFNKKILKCHNDNQQSCIKAYNLKSRILIRTRQDHACSKEPSTKAAIGKFQYQLAVVFASLKEKVPQELLDITSCEKLYLKAIDWVEKRTQNDSLPDPYWIGQFGMNVFTAENPMDPKFFLSQEEWKKKRLEVLENLKENLKKST